MARLDTTAVWFLRGDDDGAMADTPSTASRRVRLPTMAWVGGAVVLTGALIGAVVLHLAHSSRVVEAPLAIAGAAPAAAAAAVPGTHAPPSGAPSARLPARPRSSDAPGTRSSDAPAAGQPRVARTHHHR